ncbi:MAG: hydrogenase maturation nickel metallochaperone HypA [bacterium]
MHELSIAESLLSLVGEHVSAEDRPALRTVRVRVGPLSGVVADSLELCFRALVSGTPYEKARLEIEAAPARGRCLACGEEFEVFEPLFRCASCGGTRLRVEGGAELRLAEIELAEAVVKAP